MKAEKTLLKLFDTTLDHRADHRSTTLTSANGRAVHAFAAE
jgi:hypothetical protein